MNGEQLRRLKQSAWTILDKQEKRILKQRELHKTVLLPNATQFALAYICFAEIAALERQYQAVRYCLKNHLDDLATWSDDHGTSFLTWECCLTSLRGDMDHYSLINLSPEFKAYVASYYDQQKAMRQSVDSPLFITGLHAYLTDDQSSTISPEARWQAEMEEDMRNLELSFSTESFEARMKEAERLCHEQADPALILALFP